MTQEQKDSRKYEANVAVKESKAKAKQAKRMAAFIPPEVC